MNADLTFLKISIDNFNIERIGLGCREQAFKFVGIYIDEHLTWNNHINHVRSKISIANYAISKVKYLFPENVKVNIYNSLFQSYLGYGLEAWGGAKDSKLKPILMIQKKCVRSIACESYTAHTNPLFYRLRILKVHDLFKYNTYCFIYIYDDNKCPNSFKDFFTPFSHQNRTKQYILNAPINKSIEHYPSYQLVKIWNGLSLNYKRMSSIKSFKNKVKNMLLDQYQ
jgi:hypothetical protein